MSANGPTIAGETPDVTAHEAQRLADIRERASRLLDAHRNRIRQVETALNEQVSSLLEQVRREREEALEKQQQLRDRLESLHQQEGEGASGESGEDPSAALIAQLTQLEQERDALKAALESAPQPDSGEAPPADSAETDELRRRLEMAVEEVRELRRHNETLSRDNARLARQSDNGQDAAGGFDWEAQKQALIDQMETDFDKADRDAKLTVERAIRMTDQAVAEREQEIAELKQLLSEQAGSIGDVAVGAAAVAGLLDQDELIREERENLRRLQEEWREKLRKAEVDVSVERAKIARERVELEEQIRLLASEREALQGDSKAESGRKAPRGKWLSRLGLTDDKQ